MSNKEVLTDGFGKAGSVLHLPVWVENGYRVTGHDSNADRLNVANLSDTNRAYFEAGKLALSSSLADQDPSIVDITTASGHHVEAIEQVLDAGISPDAWLVEKPIDSTAEERQHLLSLLEDGSIDRQKTFVNENYNASAAIENAKKIIAFEAQRDNPVVGVDVVFYKNRVPDVRAGRFTDPTLGAFGIEMPHQVAIAYNLAGVDPSEKIDIIESRYDTNVHNVDGSDATYVVAKTQSGVRIRMAQGLGPFTMDARGTMTEQDDVAITRSSTVRLQDGREITIKFDPVPGEKKLHSILEWTDHNGEVHKDDIDDNTLKRVIGGIILFAEQGIRPVFASGLSVDNAMKYVDALNSFLDEAKKDL